MMACVIWYNQGPADPETVYANIPGAGTQTAAAYYLFVGLKF